MAKDWKAEIETLCKNRGWARKTLAGNLGISPAYLSEVIHGRRPLSMALKIKLAQQLGLEKNPNLLVDFLSDDAAEAWSKWDAPMPKDWKKITAELCARPGWNQTAVAKHLGLSRQAVDQWKNGERNIPSHYKLRLWEMSGRDRTALALEDLLPEDVAAAWAAWNKSTEQQRQS